MPKSQNIEEHQQWRLLQMGDMRGLTYFYEKYVHLIFNYGLKFTREDDLIDDSIQDLFIRIWQKRENLTVPDAVEYYLLKSFRNILFRKLSQRTKRAYSELEEEHVGDAEPSFEAQLIMEERSLETDEKLKKAWQQLPARQKEALYLRFYTDASYDDIAEIMGISVKATYKTVFRGLEKLREMVVIMLVLLLCAAGRPFFKELTLSKGKNGQVGCLFYTLYQSYFRTTVAGQVYEK
nr:sigma-70 family RNA polymerase sigma factor [uncultured Chitinophaga sp.]